MEMDVVSESSPDPDRREMTPIPMSPPPIIMQDGFEADLRPLKSPKMDDSPQPMFSPPVYSPEAVEDDDKEGDNGALVECHPMHNPVILSNLFALCSPTQLANFRLVCKLWHDISLADWRSSVCLLFKRDIFYQDRGEFWTFNGIIDETPYISTLHKFLDFIEDPRNEYQLKPYKNFHLRGWEFKRTDELVDQFFQLCGRHIISLQLNDCCFARIEELQKVIYDWCPNLKVLIIKDFKIRTLYNHAEPNNYEEPPFGEHKQLKSLIIDPDHESLPVSWLELLSHFPSISSIKVCNADMISLEVMLNAIKIIRQFDKRKLHLKHLDILSASLYAQDKISIRICQLLRELQLPLESLTIDLGVETEIKIVKDVLEVHARTLKILNAYRGPVSVPYKRFPFGVQLEALQELYMSDRLCSTLDFIKYTPLLRKLHILDGGDDGPPHIPTKIVDQTWEVALAQVRLEHLTDFYMNYIVSECDVSCLVMWMPNVKTLRMILNDKQFSIVCDKWRNLVHLHVIGVALTDEGVTGRRFYVEETGGEKMAEGIRPNITFLKSLRSFRMDNEDVRPTKLLDASAIHGFLQLDNLESLRICSQMGESTRKALMEKIPHCQVIRMIYNDTERWWQSNN